jgi:prevent-host-death family protein
MDVAMSELRSHLSTWIDRVQAGDEVVVTERGVPVVRMTPVGATPTLQRLSDEGIVTPAAGVARPSAKSTRRVPSRASVSDLVGQQRR